MEGQINLKYYLFIYFLIIHVHVFPLHIQGSDTSDDVEDSSESIDEHISSNSKSADETTERADNISKPARETWKRADNTCKTANDHDKLKHDGLPMVQHVRV